MQCNAPQDDEAPVHEGWLARLGKFTDHALLLSHVRANRCLRREVNPAERHAHWVGGLTRRRLGRRPPCWSKMLKLVSSDENESAFEWRKSSGRVRVDLPPKGGTSAPTSRIAFRPAPRPSDRYSDCRGWVALAPVSRFRLPHLFGVN